MKKILILIIILLGILSIGYFVFIREYTIKITNGTITKITDTRPMDGELLVEVNGKWNVVTDINGIFQPGMKLPDKGSVAGNLSVGKKVDVFGKKESADWITIYGNKDYYVKVLEE